MCGIFSILNNDTFFSAKEVYSSFHNGKNRGPEFSTLERVNILCDFGFHRLAINGLNSASNQPIQFNDITLICNGEIYNYKELYSALSITPTTDSDCEIIIHLYIQFGIEYTLQLLDGVFALILCDSRLTNEGSKLYIARDPFGVRPLYFMQPKQSLSIFAFASEVKSLINLYNCLNESHQIVHFEPGTYSMFLLPLTVSPKWTPIMQNIRYHSNGFTSYNCRFHETDSFYYNNIRELLSSAVQKRVQNTERPIACLLSGGLDSSLITALVKQYLPKDVILETYSIGLEGSVDLKYAKIVADFLGTTHTEIIITEEDMLTIIPEVISTIESYDTTTVRASIGNYLVAKYISRNSHAKVIFNGDGSDELCGGYLYMNCAPSPHDFDHECRRLLKDIHKFDVLRSDKSISSNGLEPRTPFLDRTFVQYYLSIPPIIRFNSTCEKYLLRKSFDCLPEPILPSEILWRRKEAFSDGVSKTTRSLYTIIQEYVDKQNIQFECNSYNQPKTNEQKYYRQIYESIYPHTQCLVPYMWMPKWVDTDDASARTLSIY